MKTKYIAAIALLFVPLTMARAFAQDMAPQRAVGTTPEPGISDNDIKLFRSDVQSIKKQIIAANLGLTDTEAERFWPIYGRYTADLAAITDRKYDLLKKYSENYTSMTDDQAENYIKGRAAVEESVMQLRLKYFPMFRKVLSGRTTALFFQLDWRLGLITELQLASQVPVVEP